MNPGTEEQELKDRLSLIETMIAEGRRSTESWGWTFVLWGVAYYVAIAWSAWGNGRLAWPVTMIAAGIVTGIGAARVSRKPETTTGRSISSIWIAMTVSIFVLMLSFGFSGRLELHSSVAIVGAMLGMANLNSSMVLKWKAQFGCAVVWLATAVAACFVSNSQCAILFLAAIFICQIVFGIYAMICESWRRKHGAAHA